MKYMGSKRSMLQGGLGEIITHTAKDSDRFVDLFTGSGSVACFIAETMPIPVLAIDLQSYATTLARSIIGRDEPLEFESWAPTWIASAVYSVERSDIGLKAAALQNSLKLERLDFYAKKARALCSKSDSPFVRAYGGWYFSPWQALVLDALRHNVETGSYWADVAVAAVVQTASRCVAAPGHTAQPFKPDTNAAPFLLEGWTKDVISQASVCASELCQRHAQVCGDAFVADANHVAASLSPRDLVFVDPPYSSVHYSRFYHVLESIARGTMGPVSGSGRYPAPEERPSSSYSIPTKAEQAFCSLLNNIRNAGASAIITFPAAQASNRMSGARVKEIASNHFDVVEDRFLSRFSTLGGNRKHRSARQDAEEMILTIRPRS